MGKPRKYLNHLDFERNAVGNERRYEMLSDILRNGTFTPKTVLYPDIDRTFREWVENELKISYNNKVLPTMVMYSNQRFTEYSQTWQYTDENKNLILNFKTIRRDNNPEYGKIQDGLWNIPGNRFYLMKREVVLDDNGSESFLDLEMRQPMAIDIIYHVSIFTTNFETINDFNILINDKFKARQAYISPNAHYMPMNLEGISDRSSYEINDRQYYSQEYTIKVNGYVLQKEDFRVSERPIKHGAKFAVTAKKKSAAIEVEEYANPCLAPEEEEENYSKPVSVIISFPDCVKETEFKLDEDFRLIGVETENIRRYELFINGEEVSMDKGAYINEGDIIAVHAVKLRAGKEGVVTLNGENPRVSYSVENDNPEIDADFKQFGEEYIVTP